MTWICPYCHGDARWVLERYREHLKRAHGSPERESQELVATMGTEAPKGDGK